jgi:cytoskeletal protein CcmA (bactofilin family)
MFSRDKHRQQNPHPTNGNVAPAPDAAPAPEASPQESPLHFVTIANPAPAAILPQPVHKVPVAAPVPSSEPVRKRLVIAEGITIQGGDILGCEHLAIEGEAYAVIDRCEKLEVLENGIFNGSASVTEAEISGYCKGTLVVRDTLRIKGTGHVVGSVQYGRLQVEEGGRIEGEMKMPLKGNGTETEPETQSENPRWLELNAKVSSQSVA